MFKFIRYYKRLISFTFIMFGLAILLQKGELPLSQKGHIETECLGINIPEKVHYGASRKYCICFKKQLNIQTKTQAEQKCLNQ